MEQGQRYRVVFHDGGPRHKEFVGVYIGVSFKGAEFSLRPLGGTASVSSVDLISHEPTDDDISLPKPVGS